MVRYAMAKKLGGFLLDGCFRDVDSVHNLPFPVFARGVTPQGPYKFGPGEINVPVCIGGIAVLPGDIIVGDSDGVVVIRPEDASQLAVQSRQHHSSEALTFQQIASLSFDHSWVEKSLREKGFFPGEA